MGTLMRARGLAIVLCLAAAPAVFSAVVRRLEARALGDRIDALVAQATGGGDWARATCAVPSIAFDRAPLAGWQTVAGCGAGASTGAGGVKWIGRNVTGGLFHVECQGNYVKLSDGYNYVATTLVTTAIGERWNLGVSVPYLYKYIYDPYGFDIDVSNQGLGDVNALLARRFGSTADWTATLSLGAPTGTSDAKFRTQMLAQERQLGHGRPTASLMLDHTRDSDWGLTVLGGTLNWRGGENEQKSYRAPSASLYSYVGYLLGPFTPAVGVSITGFSAYDRNVGGDQGTPRLSAAGNVSLEWATDWVAILLGASMPYDYVGREKDFGDAGGLGAWVVALGVAVAP